MIVIADTSGLLAAIDLDDEDHEASRRSIAQASHLVISPLVLAELDYLVAKTLGERKAIKVAEHIIEKAGVGVYEIAETPPEVLAAAGAVRLRYLELKIGLTDAVNVVLAAQYSTNLLLTLDRRRFRTLRPISGRQASFRLLPDDL